MVFHSEKHVINCCKEVRPAMDFDPNAHNATVLESQANQRTIRCLVFTALPLTISWVLTLFGVFMVDKGLMALTTLVSYAILLVPWIVSLFTGTEKSWFKYMTLFCVEAALAFIGTLLTYHTVLLFALPLFYASQFSKQRVVIYTYLLSVCGLFISVMGGYYFGICDANMLLLSNSSTADLIRLFSDPSAAVPINSNPWVTLPLHFVLPRSFTLLVFVPIIKLISGSIAQNAVHMAELVRLSETDKLTQLYNRQKLDAMTASYYSTLERVAVLFIDLNDLKLINDTYGHFQGDKAINIVAGCISGIITDTRKAYRIGGDEFVVILENPKPDEPNSVLSEFSDILAVRQAGSLFPVSASVGWSAGPGWELPSLIEQADRAMYHKKRTAHNEPPAKAVPSPDLDRTGLDDHTFQAIASLSDRMYIYLCNMRTNVSRWSVNAVDYFGLPGEYMFDAGAIWAEHIHPEDREMYLTDIENVFSGRQQRHNLEYRARNKYGDYVICTCSGIVQKGTNGEPDFFVGTMTNHGIIDTVDPVTNLYNIYEFDNAIQTIQSSRTPTMVLMIGINHFHFVNDIYDYVFGNKVLYVLAQAIQKEVQQRHGTVYRMDGAKFAMCLRGSSQEDTRELYESLRRLASESLTVEGVPVSLSISGGAVFVEKFAGSEFPIISSASYALDLSKRERHSELVFFDNELGGDTQRSMELLDALRQDIVNGCHGFYMVYQPLVRAEDGCAAGAEALLRWRSPIFGDVAPGRFIPVLEKDACFFALGNWILRQALTEAKPIVDRHPAFFLNVNIAYAQIEHRGFRDSLMDILRQTGYPPQNLCLELTERYRYADTEYLRAELQFFRSRGIRVALDDFGTGVSSLRLICDLPVDGLKIDQSFILHILNDKNAQMVVEATIDLTRKLGIDVCLEGVENQQLRDFVRRYPADHHQGFYYAHPQPMAIFHKYLEENRAAHSGSIE